MPTFSGLEHDFMPCPCPLSVLVCDFMLCLFPFAVLRVWLHFACAHFLCLCVAACFCSCPLLALQSVTQYILPMPIFSTHVWLHAFAHAHFQHYKECDSTVCQYLFSVLVCGCMLCPCPLSALQRVWLYSMPVPISSASVWLHALPMPTFSATKSVTLYTLPVPIFGASAWLDALPTPIFSTKSVTLYTLPVLIFSASGENKHRHTLYTLPVFIFSASVWPHAFAHAHFQHYKECDSTFCLCLFSAQVCGCMLCSYPFSVLVSATPHFAGQSLLLALECDSILSLPVPTFRAGAWLHILPMPTFSTGVWLYTLSVPSFSAEIWLHAWPQPTFSAGVWLHDLPMPISSIFKDYVDFLFTYIYFFLVWVYIVYTDVPLSFPGLLSQATIWPQKVFTKL